MRNIFSFYLVAVFLLFVKELQSNDSTSTCKPDPHSGMPGLPGVPGIPGTPGAPGRDGLKGEKGSIGKRGSQGATGMPGKIGPRGPEGNTGIPGNSGPRGLIGSKGDKGSKGSIGIPGNIGPRGSKGSKGENGIGRKGQKGDAAIMDPRQRANWKQCAWKRWDNTDNGKIQDPHSGILGMPGVPGIPGTPGAPGRDGFKGEKGSTGKRGSQGAIGMPGKIGPRGPDGSKGEEGKKGEIGRTGGKGSIGIPGSIGPKGSKGSKGENGIGTKGQKGDAANIDPRQRANWKQCAWRGGADTDDGKIKECSFNKVHDNTALRVSYQGLVRTYTNRGCNRWYFKFNGNECSGPLPIESVVYNYWPGGLSNVYRSHFSEGYCENLARGTVSVEVWVGKCSRFSTPGNALTGWNSVSRIMIEEVPPSQ